MNDLKRLSRLTTILILLQSKRLLTASELSRKFGVSTRTIYRDVKALESAGVPIFAEEGKGYSLMEGYNLPPIMFTEEEANALITAEKLVSRNKDQSLIENHQNAIAKVKAVLQFVNKGRANLLSQRMDVIKNIKKEISSNNLSTIQKAITHLNLIQVKYLSIQKQELSERKIEPLGLYLSHDNWVLIAWCRLRKGFREFRLDRIKELKVLDEHFEKRDFDLLPYFLKEKYDN